MGLSESNTLICGSQRARTGRALARVAGVMSLVGIFNVANAQLTSSRASSTTTTRPLCLPLNTSPKPLTGSWTRAVFTTMPTVPVIHGRLNLLPGSKGRLRNCGSRFFALGILSRSSGRRSPAFIRASTVYSLGWMRS